MNRTSQSQQVFNNKGNLIHHLGGNTKSKARLSSRQQSYQSSNGFYQSKMFSQTNPMLTLQGVFHNTQSFSGSSEGQKVNVLMNNLIELKENLGLSYHQTQHKKPNVNFVLYNQSPVNRQMKITSQAIYDDDVQAQKKIEKTEKTEENEKKPSCHDSNTDKIIQALNKALDRLEELETQHRHISKKLQAEALARQAAQLENQQLKKKNMDREKDQIRKKADKELDQAMESRVKSMQVIQGQIEDLKDKLQTEILQHSRINPNSQRDQQIEKSRLLNTVYL